MSHASVPPSGNGEGAEAGGAWGRAACGLGSTGVPDCVVAVPEGSFAPPGLNSSMARRGWYMGGGERVVVKGGQSSRRRLHTNAGNARGGRRFHNGRHQDFRDGRGCE